MARLASHATAGTTTIPLERNLDPGWDRNPEPLSRAASIPGSELYKRSQKPGNNVCCLLLCCTYLFYSVIWKQWEFCKGDDWEQILVPGLFGFLAKKTKVGAVV